MNLESLEYILLDPLRALKRNIKTTTFSIITASIIFLVFQLFLLYTEIINKNSKTIFANDPTTITVLKLLGVAALIILLPILLILVASSFKMAVFSRKDEIHIMRLIGATDKFIKRPFIVEGIIIGGISAILGSLSLYILYSVTSIKLAEVASELAIVPPSFIITGLLLKSLMVGVIISPLINIASLKKYTNY